MVKNKFLKWLNRFNYNQLVINRNFLIANFQFHPKNLGYLAKTDSNLIKTSQISLRVIYLIQLNVILLSSTYAGQYFHVADRINSNLIIKLKIAIRNN